VRLARPDTNRSDPSATFRVCEQPALLLIRGQGAKMPNGEISPPEIEAGRQTFGVAHRRWENDAAGCFNP
jgi:hypothetical protein